MHIILSKLYQLNNIWPMSKIKHFLVNAGTEYKWIFRWQGSFFWELQPLATEVSHKTCFTFGQIISQCCEKNVMMMILESHGFNLNWSVHFLMLTQKERCTGWATCTQVTLFPYEYWVFEEKMRFGPVSGLPGPKRVSGNCRKWPKATGRNCVAGPFMHES